MFNTLEKDETAHKSGKRTVFIVSDATAITAETLAHSVLTQFTDLQYDQVRIPFIDTPEKAVLAAQKINDAYVRSGVRPLVFSTFVDVNIHKTFTEKCQGFRIEFFRSFIKEIEQETGLKSAHSMGRSHVIKDEERYNRRIEAINYSLAHDDGQMNKGLNEADVILVGVSRSGKTPTSLFLAMQFGVKAANYPLIPEDFERGELPEVLRYVLAALVQPLNVVHEVKVKVLEALGRGEVFPLFLYRLLGQVPLLLLDEPEPFG